MSAAQIGGAFGAVVGFVGFVALRWLAGRLESGVAGASGADRERTLRVANVLRLIAVADMILLTLVGYFTGPLVLGRG